MKFGIVLALATACLSSVALAAAPEAPYPLAVARSIRQGVTFENFLVSVMSPFRTFAGKEGLLTREIVDRVAKQHYAEAKTVALVQFVRLDVDLDGKITKAEMEGLRSLSNGGEVTVARSKALLSADTDGDGNVSLLEAYAHAQTDPQPSWQVNLSDYLSLGDGSKVTTKQVMDQAIAVFGSIDIDGDTILSEDEIGKVAARIPPNLKRDVISDAQREIASCNFPHPSRNAETVLLGTFEGDAMADVHINNPYEKTTSSSVVIQPGKTPLYIVVTSNNAQIWAVSGAAERVEKLVITAPRGGGRSGVVGLTKDRVSFSGNEGRDCISSFSGSGTSETGKARKAFVRMVGSAADHVGGTYRLSKVLVPEMTFEYFSAGTSSSKAPEEFDATSWESALYFRPRGLVRFDPASVVASEPAKRYEVLPQEFGLSQLVHSGQLERAGPGVFRIARPIPQFPAGLAGAQAVRFLLAKGVPMPAGDSGHSCVASEESGEIVGPVGNASCIMIHPKLDPQGESK